MVILHIDTSSRERILVMVEKDGDKIKVFHASKVLRSQALLPLIEKTFKKYRLKLSDFEEIKVNPGPGSFTGLRVGVAVANALGWTLGITVNGKDVRKEPAEPLYG